MCTKFEDLPNELFLYIFSNYFDGVQLYKNFFQLNFRFNCLLKSLKNLYIHLKYSDDDKCLNLFSKNIISLYIDIEHKSIKFIPLIINIQSITLIDSTIIQIMNLLDISKNLQHISLLWTNPYLINIISARAFYELIFCASSSENLRSSRFYLPPNHSLYFEPKYCILPLLHSLYVQITIPIEDFRRIIRLCPNLIRLEIEIISNTNNNEETLIVLGHYEHLNIKRFHIYNLLSLDILDIYIGYIPNIKNLYISMKFSLHPMYIFKELSNIINRINNLEKFYFHFTTKSWNIDQQQLEILKELNPFFQNIHMENYNNEIIFF